MGNNITEIFKNNDRESLYEILKRQTRTNGHVVQPYKSLPNHFYTWWSKRKHLTAEEIFEQYNKSSYSYKKGLDDRFQSVEYRELYDEFAKIAVKNGHLCRENKYVSATLSAWWRRFMHLPIEDLRTEFSKSLFVKQKGYDKRFTTEGHRELYKKLKVITIQNGFVRTNSNLVTGDFPTWWKKVMHLSVDEIMERFRKHKYSQPKTQDGRFVELGSKDLYLELSAIAIKNDFTSKTGGVVNYFSQWWRKHMHLTHEEIRNQFNLSKFNLPKGYDKRFITNEHRELYLTLSAIAKKNGHLHPNGSVSSNFHNWWKKVMHLSVDEINSLFYSTSLAVSHELLYKNGEFIESLVRPIAKEVKSVFMEFKSREFDSLTRSTVKKEFIAKMSKVTDDQMLCEVLANNYLSLSSTKTED